jgi:hypothetical protein
MGAKERLSLDGVKLRLQEEADGCAGQARAALDEAIKAHELATPGWRESLTNARFWLARLEGIEFARDTIEEVGNG